MRKILVGMLWLTLETSAVHAQQAAAVTETPETPATKQSWVYKQETDEMTGKVTRWACIHSTNQLQLDFPYSGGTTGRLCVSIGRTRYAYFDVSKGQLMCSILPGGCSIDLKVDGGKPTTMWGEGSSTGDPTTIYILAYSRFVSIAKKAKQIKVEATYFREGPKVLTFDPDAPLISSW